MMSALMETMLDLWASSLRAVKARMAPLFTQARVAASAGRFLDGLLGPERRKTGWMRAEAAGDPEPWRQQAILGRASCGVGRQYTGSAGKITNYQIGVFAAYVSQHGHAFVDRALCLPKAWTDDPARLAVAHVPKAVGFATKPRLARHMIERAVATGMPFRWVTADSVYGVGELEMALRRAGRGYVLGVNVNSPFHSWIGKPEVAGTAQAIAQELAPADWQQLSAGEGTQGRGCVTGPTSNWPTWKPMNTTPTLPACGRVAC